MSSEIDEFPPTQAKKNQILYIFIERISVAQLKKIAFKWKLSETRYRKQKSIYKFHCIIR